MVDVVCVCPCVCLILAVTGRVSYTEDLWSGYACALAKTQAIFTINNDTADKQFLFGEKMERSMKF